MALVHDHLIIILGFIFGLTFLVAGALFFLISTGLDNTIWRTLGFTGLALGFAVLLVSTVLWICSIKNSTNTKRRRASIREDTEMTFSVIASEFET